MLLFLDQSQTTNSAVIYATTAHVTLYFCYFFFILSHCILIC